MLQITVHRLLNAHRCKLSLRTMLLREKYCLILRLQIKALACRLTCSHTKRRLEIICKETTTRETPKSISVTFSAFLIWEDVICIYIFYLFICGFWLVETASHEVQSFQRGPLQLSWEQKKEKRKRQRASAVTQTHSCDKAQLVFTVWDLLGRARLVLITDALWHFTDRHRPSDKDSADNDEPSHSPLSWGCVSQVTFDVLRKSRHCHRYIYLILLKFKTFLRGAQINK